MTTQPTNSDSLEYLRDTVLIQASIVQSPKYNDSDSLVKSVDNIMKAIDHYTTTKINEAVEEARKETERQCFVYMEPGRIQDYKNRRDVTFQNDPRLSTNSRKGKNV